MSGYLRLERSPTMYSAGSYAKVHRALGRAVGSSRMLRFGGLGATGETIMQRIRRLQERATDAALLTGRLGHSEAANVQTLMSSVQKDIGALMSGDISGSAATVVIDNLELQMGQIEARIASYQQPIPSGPTGRGTSREPLPGDPDTGLPGSDLSFGGGGTDWLTWALVLGGVAAVGYGVFYYTKRKRR